MIVLNCACILLIYLAPQAWTEAPSVPKALVSMLLRLPDIKFVIVTLGEDGCIMVERSGTGKGQVVVSFLCLKLEPSSVCFRYEILGFFISTCIDRRDNGVRRN